MTGDLAEARSVWARRQGSRSRDRAFIAYSIFLGAIVVVAPLVRLAWLVVSSDPVVTALAQPDAAAALAVIVCAGWAAALFAGSVRGPALLPPFLNHAWADSRFRGTTVFCRQLTSAVGGGALMAGLLATAVAASLVTAGVASPRDVVGLAAVGVASGVITVALWLTGQWAPRLSPAASGGLLGIGVAGLAFPSVAPFLPWNWLLTSYPGEPFGWHAFAALAFTALIGGAIPWLLDRLDPATLATQSARWDLAVAHVVTLDLRSASESIQARPVIGRNARAVRGLSRLSVVFFVRDAVGAVRLPGRTVRGLLLLGGSGALLVVAMSHSSTGPALALLAGLLAFAGAGGVSAGLAHAIQVAGDLPLFGISDARLVVASTVFPAIMSTCVPAVGALVAVKTLPELASLWLSPAPIIGILALVARVSDLLRGPSPSALLVSAPSPMGDPMPAVRVLWAFDAAILSAVAGLAALASTPFPLAVTGLVAVATVVVRWRRRD